jgi:hypothetical protein
MMWARLTPNQYRKRTGRNLFFLEATLGWQSPLTGETHEKRTGQKPVLFRGDDGI